MKRIVWAFAALALSAALAAPRAAETPPKKKKSHSRTYAAQSRPADGSGYFERLADKLPYGSTQWWHQMDHENRGGR